MSKAYCLLLLCLVLQPAMAATTDDDFWKNCPGPACPANAPSDDFWKNCPGPACPPIAPSRDADAYQRNEDRIKQMDKTQLEQERKLHEKVIKEIQREEKQRYER